ncbi:MAG TPA: quinolinate synthase NadA [Terriglobales bacterium]|nr:quinolinate synthase NadA [Terriglobales bacterium]
MPLLAESACDLDNYLRYPDEALDGRIAELRRQLGKRVLLLAHHYQREEVVRFADYRGDSFRLAQRGLEHPEAEFIVFCGVHFMAESADILRAPGQQVILPDLNAGCSMADMAEYPQVLEAWEQIEEWGLAERFMPITYMNSTAAIKAFCGEKGGLVCTSSNAPGAFRWGFAQRPQIFFLPDQHLGRNTGVKLGLGLNEMTVWDPRQRHGGLSREALAQTKVLLWKGHCSVHQRFKPEHVDKWRRQEPGIRILVHPECSHEVVANADLVGSTDYIIRQIAAAPAGTRWAIGTELHLVHRLAKEFPTQLISPLDNDGCPVCSTMFRISPQHVAWTLDNLVQGQVVNRVVVKEQVKHWARVALNRMLAVGAPGAEPPRAEPAMAGA